jgi:cell division septum initiation protein DivIVA
MTDQGKDDFRNVQEQLDDITKALNKVKSEVELLREQNGYLWERVSEQEKQIQLLIAKQVREEEKDY